MQRRWVFLSFQIIQEYALEEGFTFNKTDRVKRSFKRVESFDVSVYKPTRIEDQRKF